MVPSLIRRPSDEASGARADPYHDAVATPDGGTDPDDTLVVIGHPYGDVEVPLAVWIATGPGPRPGVRPIRARSRSTGQPLPLSVIPLRYRNNWLSRLAIRHGLLDDPWPPADQSNQHDPGDTS
jgi:hypothetical protein